MVCWYESIHFLVKHTFSSSWEQTKLFDRAVLLPTLCPASAQLISGSHDPSCGWSHAALPGIVVWCHGATESIRSMLARRDQRSLERRCGIMHTIGERCPGILWGWSMLVLFLRDLWMKVASTNYKLSFWWSTNYPFNGDWMATTHI